METFSKSKIKKIDILREIFYFWATKASIPNDTDPLCEQFWKP